MCCTILIQMVYLFNEQVEQADQTPLFISIIHCKTIIIVNYH